MKTPPYKTTLAMSHGGMRLAVAAIVASAAGPLASGQAFDLSWHTIDGGGAMFTAAGSFELSGTVGQPDAGAMTGGAFEVIGGFWPGAGLSQPCDPCDANCDGAIDAFDVEPFIAALLGGSRCSGCSGDVNADGVIDAFDIEPFVNCLVGP